MSKPLVSIALCTYNGERFLIEQLDTLLNQTYSNLEIIIVDDLSTDHTFEILKRYAAKHSIIKLFQNTENLGYIKNFEKAIRLCKGEFIALSDQDDIWDLKKIDLQVEYIKDNMLLYHNSELIDEKGKNLNTKIFDICNPYRGRDPKNFILGNCVSGHTMLFKKELIGYIKTFPNDVFYDQWLAYVASSIGKIDYLNLDLVKFRRHDSNSTDILRKNKNRTHTKDKRLSELSKLHHFLNYKFSSTPEFANKFLHVLNQKKMFGFNYKLFIFLIRHKEVLLSTSKKSILSKLNFLYKYTSTIH